jgi:hypothetical protein
MHLRFDRGTILLCDPPPEANLSDLPGVLWDARGGALRAPAKRLGAIKMERLLCSALRAPGEIRSPPEPDAPARGPMGRSPR